MADEKLPQSTNELDISSLQSQAPQMDGPITDTPVVEEATEDNAPGISNDEQSDKLKAIFKDIFQKDTKTIMVSNYKKGRSSTSFYDVQIKPDSLEYTLQSSSNKRIYSWNFNSNDLKIDGESANQEFRSEFSKRLISMANDIKAQKAVVLEEKK